MIKRSGFTLLELLVAMAMVAVLAGSLYACIYIGFKSRETAMRAIEPAQRIGNVFTMLAQDLDGTLPPTGTYASEFQGFGGSASSGGTSSGSGSNTGASSGSSISQGLTAAKLNSSSSSTLHIAPTDPGAVLLLGFYSASNTPRPDEFGGDLRKLEYSIEIPDRSSRPALVRHVYTNLAPSKQPVPRDQVLCRNVRAASVRFWDGQNWLDTWDSSAQSNLLPLAVELSLELDLPDSKLQQSDWLTYKVTRVFKIPCATLTVSSSSSTSGSTGATGTKNK